MLLTRKQALLEKLSAERFAGYKSGLSRDQIRKRIEEIKGIKWTTKGYGKRKRKTEQLYSDIFGKDYLDVLDTDKRFRHATRAEAKTINRQSWFGPIFAKRVPVKQLKALEKVMEKESSVEKVAKLRSALKAKLRD